MDVAFSSVITSSKMMHSNIQIFLSTIQIVLSTIQIFLSTIYLPEELLAEVGWDGLIVLCLQQQDVGLQVLNPLVRAVKGD